MKGLIKSIVRAVAICLVSPLLISHAICTVFGCRDDSLETHSQLLSLLPGTWGSYLRVAFLRFALDECDPSATIGFGVLFSKCGAQIHQNAYIGPRCMIGLVTIGRDVLLGPAVQIPSGPSTHGIASLETPIRQQPGKQIRVVIGADSWIGAGAIVLADVAPQCIVGAGSIVTKPTLRATILVGNPARSIAKRGEPTMVPTSGTPGAPATEVDEVRAG